MNWKPRLRRWLACLPLAVILFLGADTPSAVTSGLSAEPPGPTDVSVTTRDSMALVSWNAQNLTSYQIAIGQDSQLANPRIVTVDKTSGLVDDLQPAQTYFVRITGITPGGTTSRPSQTISFTTPGVWYPLPQPSMELTAQTTTSLKSTWPPMGLDVHYEVQLSQNIDDWAGAVSKNVTSTDVTFTGLAVAMLYFGRIRVVGGDGDPLSAWSQVMPAATLEDSPLRVGSYNIRCQNCGGPSWNSRKSAVAATIKGVHPDIVGVQEASQAKSTGPQFDQLLKSLGAPFKGTTQRISGATDGIVYNSSTVELLHQGSVALEKHRSDRRLAWGVFRQKATGKIVLFASTHLNPGKGSTNAGLRKREAKQIVSALKKLSATYGKPPTILVGDLNSYPGLSGGNAAYHVLADAYRDPLGNASDPGVTKPEKLIHANYSSFNGYKRNPPKNGTYLDYIFMTPMRVSEWETVVKVNSSGRLVGTIPSDHNMVRADVYLP